MKLLIASDLHFEFQRDAGRTLVGELAPADAFVVAGDLCCASGLGDALDLCCERYTDVVFVAGNHEYYGSSFPRVRAILHEAEKRHGGKLHVLERSTCEIGGVRFAGTTMWTRRTPWIHKHQHMLSDFSVIEDADPIVYEENREALAFLEREVSSGDVVVTHHLPADRSVARMFKRSPLNCFFLCDVEPLISERQPRLWVHGHTHSSCDYLVGSTRVLCNPFGYAGRALNPDFRSDFVVDL